MTDLDFLKYVANTLERLYATLERSHWIEAPKWLESRKQYRHEKKHDRLLVYLKGVRGISLLNASLVLLEAGHVHEMGILCRCMDESFEDMMLFIRSLGPDGEPTDKQKRVFEEFFQEEFEDLSAPILSTAKRDRVPRNKVRTAIAGLLENPVNPHEFAQISQSIYNAFSGYVHGAYPHIMELYGGKSPRYHMSGMLVAQRIQEWERMLIEYTYRGALGAWYVAKRLDDEGVVQEISLLIEEMEIRYPHFKNDPNILLREMKKKNSEQK